MALVSPLYRFHQQAEASLTPYGPAVVSRPAPEGKTGDSEAGSSGGGGGPSGGGGRGGEGVLVEVVETFGQLDLEYAALRRSCVVIDEPNRAVLEVTGAERVDFLNRMLTQELKGLKPGDVRRSFWLSRKGRIDADVRVIAREDRVLLEVDVHAARRTLEGLSAYVISEDVEIRDVTEAVHRLAFHGPGAAEIVARLLEASDAVRGLPPGRACEVGDCGASAVVFREDTTGEVGLELILPVGEVVSFYQRAVELFGDEDGVEPQRHRDTEEGEEQRKKAGAETPSVTGTATPPPSSASSSPPSSPSSLRLGASVESPLRLRPAGWHAFNIARLEAGTPLYNLDFGVESLPAESGVLHDRVSFTKGCYLGQEIVARMHARQQLKQQLVALKFESVVEPAMGVPAQPVTGAMLFAPPKDPAPTASLEEAIAGGAAGNGEPMGVVTSSAISPMLGALPVAFAQVKSSHASAGSALQCAVGPTTVRCQVQESLRFWARP